MHIGPIKKKILLLLLAGVALSFSGKSYQKHSRIYEEVSREWRKITRRALTNGLVSLFESRLIKQKSNNDGTISFVLSEDGKKIALKYNLECLEIKLPNRWDGKWRIVMFDVPERYKKVRESLRIHFRKMGMIQLQKSVFVNPYPCEKEIRFIVQFYNCHKAIRFILADAIDNEEKLIRYFKIDTQF